MRLTLAPAPLARIVVSGIVEPGDRRGRLLGFPTANLPLTVDDLLVGDGVYAGWAHLDDGSCAATAVSVGRRPTFYADRGLSLLEAHLLDFDGDLYGRQLTVELVARLRGQVRFDGADALQRQLATDVQRCRDVLTRFAPGR
jgi:riboflavin kinase/FMN adenylyltransferase